MLVYRELSQVMIKVGEEEYKRTLIPSAIVLVLEFSIQPVCSQ